MTAGVACHKTLVLAAFREMEAVIAADGAGYFDLQRVSNPALRGPVCALGARIDSAAPSSSIKRLMARSPQTLLREAGTSPPDEHALATRHVQLRLSSGDVPLASHNAQSAVAGNLQPRATRFQP